jgi:4-hydroxy-tetrahydrodipicolinate reductase
MGSSIVRLVGASSDMEVVGLTERPGAGQAALASQPGLALPVSERLGDAIGVGADVVIDFSSAQAAAENARVCVEKGVRLVIGTTGLPPEARQQIVDASKRVPIVMAPNMSVGVTLMQKLVEEAAHVLGDAWDVEVLELHHRHKKDAPSGTALRLAEVVAGALGRQPSDLRMSREGQIGERPRREIGIQAIRGGDIVGEHTVFFVGEGERLEITHRAGNRDQFALGALRAARFLMGKQPGLYDMFDVLGLAR